MIQRATCDRDCELAIVARQSVTHSRHDKPTLLQQGRRRGVDVVETLETLRSQSCPQERAEEMVVAVPVPGLVQRNHEQVGGEQVLQYRRGVSAPGQPLAQGGVELVEHRREEQELDPIVRERSEYLAHQIVGYRALGRGQCVQEPTAMRCSLERHRCKLDGGRPALRQLAQPHQFG